MRWLDAAHTRSTLARLSLHTSDDLVDDRQAFQFVTYVQRIPRAVPVDLRLDHVDGGRPPYGLRWNTLLMLMHPNGARCDRLCATALVDHFGAGMLADLPAHVAHLRLRILLRDAHAQRDAQLALLDALLCGHGHHHDWEARPGHTDSVQLQHRRRDWRITL